MLELGIVLSIVVVLVAAIITLRAHNSSFISNARLEGRRGALQEAIQHLEEQRRERADEFKELDKWSSNKALLQEQIKDLEQSKGSLEEEERLLKQRVGALVDELDRKLGELAEKDTALKEKRAALSRATAELEVVQRKLEKAKKELDSLPEPGRDGPGSERVLPQSAFEQLYRPRFEGPGEAVDGDFHFDVNAFMEYLGERGFSFPERLVKAFHTSLMAQDISSLTVMAGVSGTGKTTLPKLYAEFTGMRFLLVPVEPRWDSPQDLFGFMNYLEGRYEATELGRALRQFNIVEGEFKDRMLLVLLDEMNLARVEYYFSEFLSRLEMRREIDDWSKVGTDSDTYGDVSMEIFSGQGKKESDDPKVPKIAPIRLLAAPNVLFVGTMNEDETTNNLSDKVMDRSNVIRFGRPKVEALEYEKRGSAERASPKELTYASFKGAVDSARLREGATENVRDYLGQLNKSFEEVRRHFGYRTSEATFRYIQSHPDHFEGEGVAGHRALADQVAMRYLPRLNGIEHEVHSRTLDEIEDLVGKLDDGSVLEAFRKAKQGDSIFQWPGIEWDEAEEG